MSAPEDDALHKQFSHSSLVIYQGVLLLSSLHAPYMGQKRMHFNTQCFTKQFVAQHIFTQCISAVLLVVVSYCLVGGSNIICMNAPVDDVAVIY
jgi:hypothetical protein